MKKFSISIVLAVLAAVQFMMTSVFAESEKFEENFLDAIGIISMDEDYNSDAPVSRIEFLKMVFEVTKTDTEQYSDEDIQPFFDVTENDEFFNIANLAYNMEIIKGGTDGCFRPYTTISPDEATTILLRALYGSDLIEKLGGASAVADTLRLYKDLKVGDAGFTYKNAAVLIYNALSADFIEENYDGTYYFDKESSLLYELYEIEYVEGMVDGNYKQSIYETPTKYNFITIDGEVYKLENEKYNDMFFGQNVCAYYRENADEDLVIVYMESEKGSVTKYDFDDLVSLDSEYISYVQPGKGVVKKEDLSRTCITMHNNIRVNLTKAFDVSGNGHVICIDNDDDGRYDILDITTYDIYIVKNVNTVYDRIGFENSDDIIELKNYGEVRIVDKEGKALELADISRYSVAEVSISQGREVITITVVTDKISVKVASVLQDSYDNSVVITADDGTEYKTVSGFNEDLRPGMTYTFALDSKKNICARLSEEEGVYKIGCVMKTIASVDEPEGFIRLMGTDEKISELIIPEKVTCVNYGKRFTVSEAIAMMNESYVIRYTQKDGVMTSFEVASEDEKYQGLQKMTELPEGNNAYTRYWKNAMIIGGRIPLKADTVIIRQDDSKNPDDESAYIFNSVSDLSNASYYPSSVAYRIGNTSFSADVILIKKKDVLNKYSPIMLISSITKKFDTAKGEARTVIKGLVGNAEKEIVLSEDALATYISAQGKEIELGVGDCIRYGVNKKGEVILVKLIFDYSDMQMYGNNDGNDLGTAYGVEELHRTGVVEYVRDDYVKIIADGLTTQEDYFCSLKDGGVYQVSVQNGRVTCETITAYDIESLEKDPDLKDKVFVRMHNGLTGVFIVYKQD